MGAANGGLDSFWKKEFELAVQTGLCLLWLGTLALRLRLEPLQVPEKAI
jgi:hypothetical protein